MLAKPRQMTSAMSLVGACADAETGTPAQSGSGVVHTAMPGTLPRLSATRATRCFDDPGGRNEMAERPLERSDRRRAPAEHGANRGGLRGIRLRRPVAVRDDHPDIRGANSRFVERLPDCAHDAIAVVADRDQPLRFAGVAAAQVLADHRRFAAGRGRFRFEHHRASAFAEQAAGAARVERQELARGEEPESVVIEHHLGLDWRVVPHRDRAVGFARAERGSRLDHRLRASAAVVGDAGVGPFEHVTDSDVTQHVVGQRAQQPHRVDRIGELAAEGVEFAMRLGHQREEVVLVLVVSAARAYKHSGAVVECRSGVRSEGVAVRDDARCVECAACRVDADQVRAPDELVELAIVDERARIEVGNLRGDAAGPSRRIPQGDRRER